MVYNQNGRAPNVQDTTSDVGSMVSYATNITDELLKQGGKELDSSEHETLKAALDKICAEM
jgi:hypothetical protein